MSSQVKGLYQDIYDPYKLPENENVIISFSGGRTSAYMIYKIIDRNNGLPDNCKVVFSNTGREFPETLDFVQAVADDLGIEITWLEYARKPRVSKGIIVTDKMSVTFKEVTRETASLDGQPFLDSIEQSAGGSFLPNMFARYCTQEMKFRTIKRYLTQSLGWKTWVAAIGVRNDEGRRARPSRDNRQVAWFPLNDDRVKQPKILEFWDSMPFNLELTRRSPDGKYVLEGNCDCCFMKSEESLALMYKYHPERFKWWEDLEAKTGSYFYDKRKYKDLREKIDQLPESVFDTEGFFCQSSQGECTSFDDQIELEL